MPEEKPDVSVDLTSTGWYAAVAVDIIAEGDLGADGDGCDQRLLAPAPAQSQRRPGHIDRTASTAGAGARHDALKAEGPGICSARGSLG